MANLSITITNRINCFGPAPTDKWGTGSLYTFTWGVSKWGEGTVDLVTSFLKVITNTITPSYSHPNSVTKVIANTISSTEDLSREALTNGVYNYVFPGNATNAENRVISTYSAAAAVSSTYSSGTAGTTTWS